jgi:general stress protein 26
MERCAFFSIPTIVRGPLSVVAVAVLALPAAAAAQAPTPAVQREQLIAAARQIMGAQTYCAFITVDSAGRPQVRTVNPFPPEEDMTVWFATSTLTRKVRQIRANPHVALYYADHAQATGYVQLSGRAELVSDPQEIARHRRAYWQRSFPGDRNLVLVKVVPERLDVLNYAAGTPVDSVTWRTSSIELGPTAPAR